MQARRMMREGTEGVNQVKASAEEGPRMLIVGARVFDGRSDQAVDDIAIEIAGDRISRVGRRADFGETPTSGEVVDAAGLFVMPGLINMHEHLIFRGAVGLPTSALSRTPADLAIHAVRVAAVALAQGITTVRDMGAKHGIALAVRAAVEAGAIPGPRVIACNSAIRITGGHGFQAVEADGADGFRAAARVQLAAGADFIKVMASHDPWPMPGHEQTRPEATLEELRAAFEAAHAWGRPAAAHVMGAEAIGRVLDADVQVIDHGHYLTDALAERMASRGVFLTPTLSAYGAQTMHPRFGRGAKWAADHEVLRAGHASAMRAAIGAGVRLLVGTDSVGCYAEEVDLLRRAGVSAIESLRACTSNAAAALGKTADLGALGPGMAADLVAFPSDPITDPYALEDPAWVIKAGRRYDPRQLRYAAAGPPGSPSLPELVRAPR